MSSLLFPVICPTISTKRPRIGYDNAFADTGAVITTSAPGAVGFEYTNAYDWLPYSYWKPGFAGATELYILFPAARAVNYFGLYAHNIGTTGSGGSGGVPGIILQYSTDNGVNYIDAFPEHKLYGAECVYESFPQILANKWRVRINNVGGNTLIGCLSFGVDMLLEQGMRVGFAPPNLARETRTSNNTSDRGAFLGRSIYGFGGKSALTLDPLTEAWTYGKWLPFMIVAELRPWFLKWDNINYPLEAAFCWSDGAIQKPTYSRPNFFSAGINFQLRTS